MKVTSTVMVSAVARLAGSEREMAPTTNSLLLLSMPLTTTSRLAVNTIVFAWLLPTVTVPKLVFGPLIGTAMGAPKPIT